MSAQPQIKEHVGRVILIALVIVCSLLFLIEITIAVDPSGTVAGMNLAVAVVSLVGLLVPRSSANIIRAVVIFATLAYPIAAQIDPLHTLAVGPILAVLVVAMLRNRLRHVLIVIVLCSPLLAYLVQPDEITTTLFVRLMASILIVSYVLYRYIDSEELTLATLKTLASTDTLTGVLNRRAFDDYLGQQVEHSKRTGDYLSLILIDIDYFKTLNDSQGHLMGDKTLAMVSKAIRSSVVRDADRICRYGGDEFAVVLPHTASEGALAIAQRIQQSVATLNLANKHSPIADRVTVSIGVGTHGGESPSLSNIGLIATADLALYQAKANGRNQIR